MDMDTGLARTGGTRTWSLLWKMKKLLGARLHPREKFHTPENPATLRIAEGALLVTGLLAMLFSPSSGFAQCLPPGTGKFLISGNQICDPSGKPFKIKGVTAAYATFSDGQTNNQLNAFSSDWAIYLNRVQDMQAVKAAGANLVRIFIATWDNDPQYNNPNYSPTPAYPLSVWQAAGKTPRTVPQMLDDVVSAARNQGLVVLLVNSYSDPVTWQYGPKAIAWLQYLSTHYKNDPYVWFSPSNEPFCNSGIGWDFNLSQADTNTYCFDWANWQQDENALIQAIRNGQTGINQGSSSPILVNGVGWSSDLSQINVPANQLTDPMFLNNPNLAYGAHRYANDCAHFNNIPNAEFPKGQITDVNNLWASLSSTNAIYVDEVGNYNGPQSDAGCNGTGPRTANALSWNQDFIPWVATWTQTRSGSGAIGFTWHWNDGNNMTGSKTSDPVPANETLSSWGRVFKTQFLQVVH
jgi:hypothetical protein